MFAVRSYMLDISRDKVPTMGTLKQLVEILEKFNYNQLQLYTEHTFAYSKHEAVWKDASPMTPSEVRELDLFCAMHGIDLVPNQNSFGHLERWLVRPEYNHLAELPHGGGRMIAVKGAGAVDEVGAFEKIIELDAVHAALFGGRNQLFPA